MNVNVSQFSEPTQPFVLSDELGEPIDLTGAVLKFAVKRSIDDEAPIFDVEGTPDVDQTTNPGKFTLAFDYNQTSIPPGTYVAALRVWLDGIDARPPDRVEASTYGVAAGLIPTET